MDGRANRANSHRKADCEYVSTVYMGGLSAYQGLGCTREPGIKQTEKPFHVSMSSVEFNDLCYIWPPAGNIHGLFVYNRNSRWAEVEFHFSVESTKRTDNTFQHGVFELMAI